MRDTFITATCQCKDKRTTLFLLSANVLKNYLQTFQISFPVWVTAPKNGLWFILQGSSNITYVRHVPLEWKIIFSQVMKLFHISNDFHPLASAVKLFVIYYKSGLLHVSWWLIIYTCIMTHYSMKNLPGMVVGMGHVNVFTGVHFPCPIQP